MNKECEKKVEKQAPKQAKDCTTLELKGMAYDLNMQLQVIDQRLRAVNEMIQARMKQQK